MESTASTMNLYRIEQTKYGAQLNGEGAYQVGGRWNHKGTRLLYTSTSRALCILETLVHSAGLPLLSKYSILTLTVPDNLINKIEKLPKGWDDLRISDRTRQCGTDFVNKKESLGLLVPSVIVPQEYNVLINILHPHMSKLKLSVVEDFIYDTRLT